ncbi:alpha/beta hydrolase [Pontibacter sp. 13R65]|uniref:alpha/beta hydrolase n=1 Tax=Pontibacter sp. 13R65 TaxID=3127458 RepID=UPI00301D537B
MARAGALSAKKICADNAGLENPMISPINGRFDGIPSTVPFIAENDITYPDQLLLIQKLREAKVDVRTFIGCNMPHIWPFLPVMKEAKVALREIKYQLKN